jgi:DNA-binding winged helix-turn-helix (wHTH) protein
MHDRSASNGVRFGPFTTHLRSRELYQGPTRLKVPDQSIEILTALLERPGDLVTHEELRRHLWAEDTFVAS